MADREPVRWITVKGKHLPVYADGSIGVGQEEEPNEVTPIKVNPNWAFQPDENTDLSDIVKNPIPFVGDGKDWEIGNLIEGDSVIQSDYKSNYEIDISKVKSLQAFVLKSGIENYKRFDDTDKPYVVEFEGNYYLMDGNHRMAKAKLDGKKTMDVMLSIRRRK